MDTLTVIVLGVVALLAGLAGLSVGRRGGPTAPPRPRPDPGEAELERVERAQAEAQAEAVKQIREEAARRLEQVEADGGLSEEELARLRAIREAIDEELGE